MLLLSSSSSSSKTFILAVVVLIIITTSLQFVFVNGEIDAETGMECVDNHENCPFWAATGECEKNPNYMRSHCKKSCDRCKFIRVNSQEEMKAYLQAQKEELRARKKLAQEKKEAMEALEGGSGGSGSGSDSNNLEGEVGSSGSDSNNNNNKNYEL